MTYDTFETLSTILLDAINIHWKFFLLISPYKISPESHIKDTSLKEMITNKKMLLIIVEILLVSILRNVQRRVRRIYILMLGCKGF